MSKFQVGDKVRVSRMDNFWGKPCTMAVGHEGYVESINSQGDYKLYPAFRDAYGTMSIFGPEELELIP